MSESRLPWLAAPPVGAPGTITRTCELCGGIWTSRSALVDRVSILCPDCLGIDADHRGRLLSFLEGREALVRGLVASVEALLARPTFQDDRDTAAALVAHAKDRLRG